MSTISINIDEKRFSNPQGQLCAIADFKLTITRNQFVCLVGPSGCGKTTLLNLIAGLDRDFSGDISLTNAGQTPHIGYVFQNPRLLPWRTVRENIELVFPDTPPHRLIDSLLAAMQLTDQANAYPEHLSLGMQRRVAIIRAFAVNPDILLMDEPFVSLDPHNARQIRLALLTLWRQRPHTVLFVSHDLREAITLADRLIFLSDSPMQALADITVNLTSEQRQDDSAIENFRRQLIIQHPAIHSLL